MSRIALQALLNDERDQRLSVWFDLAGEVIAGDKGIGDLLEKLEGVPNFV